jgi:hypothetical protein
MNRVHNYETPFERLLGRDTYALAIPLNLGCRFDAHDGMAGVIHIQKTGISLRLQKISLYRQGTRVEISYRGPFVNKLDNPVSRIASCEKVPPIKEILTLLCDPDASANMARNETWKAYIALDQFEIRRWRLRRV